RACLVMPVLQTLVALTIRRVRPRVAVGRARVAVWARARRRIVVRAAARLRIPLLAVVVGDVTFALSTALVRGAALGLDGFAHAIGARAEAGVDQRQRVRQQVLR